MLKYLPFVAIAIILLNACTQPNETSKYVGLKVCKLYDSARMFDTTKQTSNKYRPVKIDVFYPSAQQPAQPALTYGDILDMYEQRFNFNTPIDSCKKTSLMLAQMFAQGFHVDTATKFLTYKLGIYSGLQLPATKHPLIIYAASMNGSAMDNPVLFDSLAAHGYVVAVVSSVGLYPGIMSEALDLNEQVRDILFAIEQMKAQPYVDADNIGILSWSLGGLAAMKATMVSTDIKCITSFDGNDIHAYGDDTAWDKQYNQMRALPPYSPQAITVPYMYLRSEHPKKVDSLYNPILLTGSTKKYFLKFKDAMHEDFSCFPFIAKQVQPQLTDIHTTYHANIAKLTLLFFDAYLKHDAGADVGGYINKLVGGDGVHYNSKLPSY